MLRAEAVPNARGGSFFAFRLHQFLSGAWNVYTTLEPPGLRYITLDGQQFEPGERGKALFNLAFCRECGQEYLPVWAAMSGEEPQEFTRREISERSSDEESDRYGYLMPDAQGMFDPANLEKHYPEEWLEFIEGAPRLKATYRRYRPKLL